MRFWSYTAHAKQFATMIFLHTHAQYKHDKPLKYVTEFKYLGTTVADKKWTHKVKKRLNVGISRYHSDQDRLSSCLLLKSMHISTT